MPHDDIASKLNRYGYMYRANNDRHLPTVEGQTRATSSQQLKHASVEKGVIRRHAAFATPHTHT